MTDQKTPEPWVCPWGICNHQQAQECRAELHPRKGCGGRFPAGTTLEQAKKMIGPADAKGADHA